MSFFDFLSGLIQLNGFALFAKRNILLKYLFSSVHSYFAYDLSIPFPVKVTYNYLIFPRIIEEIEKLDELN